MADFLTERTQSNNGVGPRVRSDVSAFPGAPGVPGGLGNNSETVNEPDVVSNYTFGTERAIPTPLNDAFPGVTGDSWQSQNSRDWVDALVATTVHESSGVQEGTTKTFGIYGNKEQGV